MAQLVEKCKVVISFAGSIRDSVNHLILASPLSHIIISRLTVENFQSNVFATFIIFYSSLCFVAQWEYICTAKKIIYIL